MFNLKRDKKGIALLNTKWERLKLVLDVAIGTPVIIIVAVSFIWVPFWVITGKNIFRYLI